VTDPEARPDAPDAGPFARTWKLVLEYDGTGYAGWQRQAGETTVQEVLEDALSELLRERVSTVAAGRTDAGVHALGQVASFRTRSAVPAGGVIHGTNALLPGDVAVRLAEEALPGFHAQRDAKGKLYRYRILTRRVRSPVRARFSHRIGAPLDVEAMSRAARGLVGTHDFSAFRNAGSVAGSGVRTLRRLDIDRLEEYICIEAEGDGFLYKMVRNLVGTLILVGQAKLAPDEVPEILAARDRRRAGPTAPARGLCLVEVYY
jgi:tRNA pseudouridine38-40 synthase